MELFYSILLAAAAFCLGACPFAVWLGRWRLRKDITRYGDGNPGSANVFNAGGGILLDAEPSQEMVAFSKLAVFVFNLRFPVYKLLSYIKKNKYIR